MTCQSDGTQLGSNLRIDEAVLLAHALVDRTAEHSNVRVLFIKGPASGIQGIRAKRQSADVDVLVEAGMTGTLVAALRERGWEVRPTEPDVGAFPRHSETLFHRQWPNDIDLHFRFPGMEAPAESCFEQLWEKSVFVELAGQPIRVPSRPHAICLLALHALRTPWLKASTDDLAYLTRLGLIDERNEIFRYCEGTRAIAAIAPFLSDLYGQSALAGYDVVPSSEWSRRIRTCAPGSARIFHLVDAPLREKPRLIFRSLLPSDETLLAKDLYADLSARGRMRLYIGRLRLAYNSIPSLLRIFRSPR